MKAGAQSLQTILGLSIPLLRLARNLTERRLRSCGFNRDHNSHHEHAQNGTSITNDDLS